MTSIGDDDGAAAAPGPSAPWERPARWADEPAPPPPRPARSRRYAEEGGGVAASDLIAALAGEGAPAETSDHAHDATHHGIPAAAIVVADTAGAVNAAGAAAGTAGAGTESVATDDVSAADSAAAQAAGAESANIDDDSPEGTVIDDAATDGAVTPGVRAASTSRPTDAATQSGPADAATPPSPDHADGAVAAPSYFGLPFDDADALDYRDNADLRGPDDPDDPDGPNGPEGPDGPDGPEGPGGPNDPGDPDDPDGPAGHYDTPRRSWRIAGRSLVAALAVILLLVAGTEWVIKYRADQTLEKNQVHALDPSDTNISQPTVETTVPTTETGPVAPNTPKTYQAENILLLGSDDRSKAADAALGGANTDPGGSDVVMVAHLSADRSHITVVSIPRDTYVKAPTCKAWDYEAGKLSDRDFTSPYTLWRINSTYAAGGPPCTVKAVQEMTGLRIDRVIIIDFAGFAAMVDALDGIDVNACVPIVDEQLGTVLPHAGVQHIDGKQALNLVRARKVKGDTTSDIARINRQQKVLSTILKQMTSAGVLLNPIKLDSVLQAFVSNVKTDNVTIDNLLDIAQSLGNLDPRRVTFFTLQTTPDSNGVGLHATDTSELIWAALREDKALPGEVTDPVTPASTSSSVVPTTPMTTVAQDPLTSTVTSVVTTTPTAQQTLTVAPREVDLQVVNVAGRSLVANQARDALTPLGFGLASSDLLRLDGENQVGITVEYSGGNRDAALTVAAAVPGSRLVEKGGLGKQVRLMLGTSFDAAGFAGEVRKVAVGDPVPAALATEPTPVVSTVTSTVVTTPPPLTVPVTSTQAPETTESTDSPLDTLEFTSVNAASAGCI